MGSFCQDRHHGSRDSRSNRRSPRRGNTRGHNGAASSATKSRWSRFVESIDEQIRQNSDHYRCSSRCDRSYSSRESITKKLHRDPLSIQSYLQLSFATPCVACEGTGGCDGVWICRPPQRTPQQCEIEI